MTSICKLEALQHEANLLRDWMFNQAYPLWAGAGMHESGISYEALDFRGAPVPSHTVRVRVQARQLFVFARAHKLGWQRESCAPLIESLFEVLVNGCRRDDGLFGKLYNLNTRQLVDETFSLYDTAFALLGFAVARDILGSTAVDRQVDAVLTALEQRVAHQNGGFLEEIPAPTDRLQNPHMHLFESFLALRDAGYGNRIDDRLANLLGFITTQFFDSKLDIVHERRPGILSQEVTFEPGHSMEWVWLLTWLARDEALNNDNAVNPMVSGLYQRALASLNRNGYACMQAAIGSARPDATCRLWAQAEALKAHLSMASFTSDTNRQNYVDSATAICRGIRQDWLEPAFAGGWYDHLDQYGRLIAEDMPASTGYHLFGAIDALLDTLNFFKEQGQT